MSGIVFMRTKIMALLRKFYTQTIGCELWMDQGGCNLFRHGNFIFGFCASDFVEKEGILTFFYSTEREVDEMYEVMKETADGPPRKNERYQIYQFFARDPENRVLEFQYFLHPVTQHQTGMEILQSRRSVREFSDKPVPDSAIIEILESCRFAPTSINTQSVVYKIITDKVALEWLAQTRGPASAPLGKAPLAVAVCADPSKTKRPEQDADIAAYHFMLAARFLGLGTCWIAALNRDDLKEMLGIPEEYYVATVTPLGWPLKVTEELPDRRPVEDLYF